jgi:tetratricopeptide (TPR) repeat protein
LDPRIVSAEWSKKHGDKQEFDAEDIEMFRERGLALLQAGQADRAREVFEMLIELGQEDPAVHLVLSGCSQLMNDAEGAVHHLDRALTLLEALDEPELLAEVRHLRERDTETP